MINFPNLPPKIPPHLLYNRNFLSDLSEVISSTNSLIDSYVKNKIIQVNFIDKIVENFESIYSFFIEYSFRDEIKYLTKERKQMHQLMQLICNDFVNCCTREILENKDLKDWIHKFKWLILIIDHYQYVKINFYQITTDDRIGSLFKTGLVIRSNTLDLSWTDFCKLLTPLIINFYEKIDELMIKVSLDDQTDRDYSSREILLFLEQKNASPKELIFQVPFEFNDKTTTVTQAILRNTFDFGQTTPYQGYGIVYFDYKTWEKAIKLRTLYKAEYKNYPHDALYFALKVFDECFPGDPKSLIEYQNVVKFLGFDKPGIKVMECVHLKNYKRKMNEILSVFNRKDQKFMFTGGSSPIFSRKLIKHLLNSELSLYHSSLHIKTSNSISNLNVGVDIFFEALYPSLDHSKEENLFHEIIKKRNRLGDKTEYQINCTSEVIKNAQSFWRGKTLEPMSFEDNMDLFFLFSRAQIVCREVESRSKETLLSLKQWKNMFLKWNVAHN